jgi:hypothetical protein
LEEDLLSLLDEEMEKCLLIDKRSVPDGYGGKIVEWIDSEVDFDAAIVLDTSTEARIAEKQGVTNLYTITTKKAINLQYHDVFRRLSDGKIFRVTSDGDDKKTPKSANLNMRQVSAEEWELTDGQSTGD